MKGSWKSGIATEHYTQSSQDSVSSVTMYRPILPNGKVPELPWQLKFLKLNLCWPLSSEISGLIHFFHDAWAMIVNAFFTETIHADWLFIFAYIDDLELLTESLCTTFIGMMMFFRILHLQFNRKRMHRMLLIFFESVYISRIENERLFLKIKKAMRPMNILTIACISPLIIFLLTPIVVISINYTETGKPFPYKLVFPYDAQKPIPYALTVMFTSWVGIAVTTTITGEDTLVSLLFNHLAHRIKLVHNNMQNMYMSLQVSRNEMENGRSFHQNFRFLLKCSIRKQNDAMRFAHVLENIFSPMTFIVLIFTTFLLCVVAFQLASHGINLSTSRYVFWLCACLFEVHILSNAGQKLIDSSQQLADEYYMCNWESLLPYGTQSENLQLMRIILFAITRSQKPLKITVLKFTSISLSTFLKVLNASLSYFMFLNTMKDVK